jgi:hypothetical protein
VGEAVTLTDDFCTVEYMGKAKAEGS